MRSLREVQCQICNSSTCHFLNIAKKQKFLNCITKLLPSTNSVEHRSHEFAEQGFEELKTDIKAEESSVDEQFSVPVWHKADEAHSTATDKFEECARESQVSPEEPEAEDAYAELEDEEAPVEVRPVAMSEDRVRI